MVGCPRSGTTLLQSLIASHSAVASFPESNLFLCLTAPESRRGKLGIAAKGARRAFLKFLSEIEHSEMQSLLPPYAFSLKQYANSFIKTLDTLAIQQGKNWWLEKTPYHLRRVDVIEKLVQNPKFIHILRNGEDVVASLYEVTHKYPGTWGGAKDIDQCLSEWIRDIKLTACYASKPNHTIVRYEKLLADPKSTLDKVCQFIGITYSDELIEERALAADKIVKSREVWKGGVAQPLRPANSQKFLNTFNEKEQRYILEKISHIDLNNLASLSKINEEVRS